MGKKYKKAEKAVIRKKEYNWKLTAVNECFNPYP